MVIAGVDEAGRGALAGPVVAAAVVFNDELRSKKYEVWTSKIKDSKVMTDTQRRECVEWIQSHCDFGVGVVSAQEIDAIGIKPATEKAMNQAVSAVKSEVSKLKVDGRDKFKFPIPSEDIVGGDGKVLEISAASIIAKVLRDDLMIELDEQYPHFGFAGHKGYGAAMHLALINKGKYCVVHRKTYDPLKTFLNQGKFDF